MDENKAKCACPNATVVKQGFSGVLAIGSAIIMAAICGFYIAVQGSYQRSVVQADNLTGTTPTDFTAYNTHLYEISAILVLLSLLTGTYQMNKLYTVCPQCGKRNPFI